MSVDNVNILKEAVCASFCQRHADTNTKKVLCKGCAVKAMETFSDVPLKEFFRGWENVKHIRFIRQY